MEFYIPVSSADSINQTHPSFFQICLPQRITLQGEFEIALLEVSLPSELYTLVTEKDSEIIVHQTSGSTDKIQLQRKHYLTISDFIEEINDALADCAGKTKLSLEEDGVVKVNAEQSGITFSPLIRDILGIKCESVFMSSAYSTSLPNILQQHNFLNVCADIVQPLFYAKRQRQLLRRFQIHNTKTRYIMKTFEQPLYFPLCRKDFETLSIQITNDYGNPISFAKGTVFLLVHLRERKY